MISTADFFSPAGLKVIFGVLRSANFFERCRRSSGIKDLSFRMISWYLSLSYATKTLRWLLSGVSLTSVILIIPVSLSYSWKCKSTYSRTSRKIVLSIRVFRKDMWGLYSKIQKKKGEIWKNLSIFFRKIKSFPTFVRKLDWLVKTIQVIRNT